MQRLIQAQIDQGVEGTRTKNIDLYMSVVPEDWVLHDEAGHTVTRDDLRRGALEQWAIIEKLFLFRHMSTGLRYTRTKPLYGHRSDGNA